MRCRCEPVISICMQVLPLVLFTSCIRFVLNQTLKSLTKFILKNINIYNTKFLYYEVTFHKSISILIKLIEKFISIEILLLLAKLICRLKRTKRSSRSRGWEQGRAFSHFRTDFFPWLDRTNPTWRRCYAITIYTIQPSFSSGAGRRCIPIPPCLAAAPSTWDGDARTSARGSRGDGRPAQVLVGQETTESWTKYRIRPGPRLRPNARMHIFA
jgi:hypothetical protein